MKLSIEACFTKIDVPAPDPWLDSYGVSLPLGHVVARDAKGNAVSYAESSEWNLSSYTSHGQKCILYFDYWHYASGRKAIDESQFTEDHIARMRELQFLMCKRLFPSHGDTLSPEGLKDKLFTLRYVARFAEQHRCSVRDILEQREWLDAFIVALPDNRCYAFSGWLVFLDKLDPDSELGFRVAKPLRLKELKMRAKRHMDSWKQHAPLPTLIYSQLIANLSNELDDIEAHKDRLLAALHEAITLYHAAKTGKIMNSINIGRDVIQRSGLSDYFAKRGFASNMYVLISAISEIFQLCALQIHTFSGMRHKEGNTLPFHCMETEKRNGRMHALLVGTTTKFNGGRRMRTKWVSTDKDGFRAVRLTQAFAAVIYESMGVTPDKNDAIKDRYPLFVSPEYLPWGRHRSGDSTTEQFHAHELKFNSIKRELQIRLLPTITTKDITELEDIDPFRAWTEEENFAIGQIWPLTKHQLRRSLALYARASGCVRLSSLRRQLQHITNDMSAYYGNGCAFARDFLSDDPEEFKKHIAFEWQTAREEAMVLAMIWDVLHTNEPLYGGAGNFFEMQRDKGELMTREQVEKAIKAGILSYNPHPLGACIKTGVCERQMGLNLIDIACATDNCRNLVGKHSRIIQVIGLKRRQLERIDNSTLSYKAEKEELEALEKVELRWRPTTAARNIDYD
ncbi:TPA: hypothetical protein I7E53_004032 [Vibrio cholerae]|nr:hypothetical protein [Vibrio cholerae]HAS5616687.1 hypothetical protein [Vibrio cholerae]HAS5623887.1 hypothetical protein [Vibrio cholerae]HAS5624404.1 hypothetical protein [Vibrio cholerae]